MTDALRAVAELIAGASFRDFCRQFAVITDEDGELVPFVLNEAQEIAYQAMERQEKERGMIRVLLLKGRQQGMSTLSQVYLFWRCMTRPGTRAMTVAHILSATHELYGKFWRAYVELGSPEPVAPGIKSLREAGINIQPKLEPGGERGRRITFADPVRSFYRADSATEPEGIGRAGTFQVLHLSEVPQWSKADESMQAVLATVKPRPGTVVIVETTAKGASGWFFDKWMSGQRSLEKGEEPEYWPIFVPWFKTPGYARKRRQGEATLSKREREWRDKYGISNEQCYWYRDQRDTYGEKVTEEFPSSWEEAFLSSGLPFFQRETMAWYRDKSRVRRPLRKGQFRVRKTANGGKLAKFVEDDYGPTHIFEEPTPEHRYVVGIDFASGRAKDHSAIVIVDTDTKKVVCTHQSKLLPDDVLTESLLLARAYNEAFMIPERSGIGQTLVDKLVNDWGYYNVYRENDPVSVKHHRGRRYGWATSNGTRKWLLEEMAHYVHTRALEIPDSRILEEMTTFVYTDDEGEHAEAAEGRNDDMLFALAFCVRGFSQAPLPRSLTKKFNQSPVGVSSRTGY